MPSFHPSQRLSQFFLIFLTVVLLITSSDVTAQSTKRVLFLGNSYTGSNNLPLIIQELALSTGDTLIWDSRTPGGYTLGGHENSPESQEKIMTGNWDFIVLQGQSREPITQNASFMGAGKQLDKFMAIHDICSTPLLYMTWGRENGDPDLCPFYPATCTYEGMDAWLRASYLELAEETYSEVSPVSLVWNHIRSDYPDIDLYASDSSHPSLTGSYAAACSFYTSIFKKDPTGITNNYGLDPLETAAIRDVARSVVFEDLESWDFKALPISDFEYSSSDIELNYIGFNPLDYGTAESYLWDFGDGSTATSGNTIHLFESNGTYTVTLTTTSCDQDGLHVSVTDTIIQFCDHSPTVSPPNPWLCQTDSLWTQEADAYQWFHLGQPIPNTTQYLADYSTYNGASLSVMATVDGCSELSMPFTQAAVSSEFWFSISPWADPCEGDTAILAVMHNNGELSGDENIIWFKDGVSLPLSTNEDTLLIFSGGIYECFVHDPTSICPLDTTSIEFVFDCTGTGLSSSAKNSYVKFYPNPAQESLSIEFLDEVLKEEVQIFDSMGRAVFSEIVKSGGAIDLTGIPSGVYLLRVSGQGSTASVLIIE